MTGTSSVLSVKRARGELEALLHVFKLWWRRPVEVLWEVTHRAEHRVGRQASQQAERRLRHRLTKLFEQLDVLHAIAVLDDLVDNFDTSGGADAAGCALAAALDGAKLHGEPRLSCHIHSVVKYHDTPVTQQATLRRHRLVVQRCIE